MQPTNRDRKLIRLLEQIEKNGHDVATLMLNPAFFDLIGQYHAKAITRADLFAKVNQLRHN